MPSTKPRPSLGHLRAFTCLLLGLALPAVAASQQAAAGIFGQVRDESGAVLPGVAVSARSPALQVPAVTVNGLSASTWIWPFTSRRNESMLLLRRLTYR